MNIVEPSFMSTHPQIALSAGPTVSLDPESAWQQVIARDRTARFFYAVTTTGVFCRPSCKSRRPLQSNVRFFGTVEEAQAAGFRPCKRCHPAIACSRPLDEIRAGSKSIAAEVPACWRMCSQKRGSADPRETE